MTKIGTCLNLVSIAISICLINSEFGSWIYFCALLIALFVFSKVLVIRRHRTFRDRFIIGLEMIILLMRSGRSFRDSLQYVINGGDEGNRRTWEELWDVVVFSQQTTSFLAVPFLQQIAMEFIKVDRQSHKSLERLRAFRRQLKMENDFRRRSGQAQTQALIQVVVMSILFVGLLSYVTWDYGFRAILKPAVFSLILFLIGLQCVWIISRRFKWSV
jgi:Flp pilus assembly protein TadB